MMLANILLRVIGQSLLPGERDADDLSDVNFT